MNCEQLVETISLYLYGELQAPEEEEFEQHLHGCAACRGELNQHKALLRALDTRVMDAPRLLLEAAAK